jgi:7-cyano-7-deazaguanine reductase
MTAEQLVQLTYLGKSTPAPTSPDEAVLDRVPNAHPDTPYLVRFSAPEFTTLCAVTGQPDFAHFVIDYVPRTWLIESKALKFYLGSFPKSRRLPRTVQPMYSPRCSARY